MKTYVPNFLKFKHNKKARYFISKKEYPIWRTIFTILYDLKLEPMTYDLWLDDDLPINIIDIWFPLAGICYSTANQYRFLGWASEKAIDLSLEQFIKKIRGFKWN